MIAQSGVSCLRAEKHIEPTNDSYESELIKKGVRLPIWDALGTCQPFEIHRISSSKNCR